MSLPNTRALRRTALLLLPAALLAVFLAVRGSAAANRSHTAILTHLDSFNPGPAAEGASEIVTYDPAGQKLYVVNAVDATVDILDASDPQNLTRAAQIDLTPYGRMANSVDFHDGVLVAAVENVDKQANGRAVFFDATGSFLSSVEVGALPDMVTFTPDGTAVLVANEGEPNDDYTVDPEGSITIIDMSAGAANLTQADAATADFTAFNGREAEMRARGIRIFPGTGATLAQDVEPEYIAVAPDGATAFVTLQEANAFAVVDIATAVVEDILPLGLKDHSQGPATLETYTWIDRPVLGTTPAGQTIHLGGLSGLWYEGMQDGKYRFVTVPDRGPNGAPTDVDNNGQEERPFALPDYQARAIRFELDPASGAFAIVDTVMLKNGDGDPITGLPNIPGVDETPVDLFGQPLPYDPFGADLEGVLVAPDDSLWMVDEYRPAIYRFAADGILLDRFVPEGTAALAGEAPGAFGSETLPADYSTRRANRGFEALALDTDSGILYAFIQTPLANPDRAASDDSNIIRMLGINPATGAAVTEYVYLLEKPDHREATVDKIGDAVYAGDGKFYVIERDASLEPTAKKFIFEVDLRGATNVLGLGFPGGSTLEQQTADSLAALDIYPVAKRKVVNLPSIGYLAGDKPEGLALLDDGRLAVLNDNDFGLLDEPIPGDGSVGLNPDPAQVVLGLIHFGAGNQLDASDADGVINIANWPVFGNYMPDAIGAFEAGGMTYYITANEGDSRDYPGFSEEERMGDLALNPDVFPDAAVLQQEANLGRLKTSNQFGDLDRDGTVDVLLAYGARSFTIWDAYGNAIYDSGDDFAHITAERVPAIFNSNGAADSFDSRSDDKGAEPEAIAVGEVAGRTLAFIGLERVGGIMVYDITRPSQPQFLHYQPNAEGDQSPEGLAFIPAEDSPTGGALLAVANEISGTTALYAVDLVLQSYLPVIVP